MTLWLEVTQDIYELPVAVADSCTELAKMRHVSPNSISSTISHVKSGTNRMKFSKYVKVEVDE